MKRLMIQVVKKNVIENIVPIVVALKNMLEKQRSPLLKELLMYLQELMKDYKNEVKGIVEHALIYMYIENVNLLESLSPKCVFP